MFALSLDDSHDLHLDAGGNLATVEDSAAIAQRVEQHLKFWRGEWFIDRRVGVPWIEYVFVRPFDQGIAEAVLKDAVMGVPGVTEIVAFDVELQPERRGWIIHDLQLRTIYDDTVSVNG